MKSGHFFERHFSSFMENNSGLFSGNERENVKFHFKKVHLLKTLRYVMSLKIMRNYLMLNHLIVWTSCVSYRHCMSALGQKIEYIFIMTLNFLFGYKGIQITLNDKKSKKERKKGWLER